MDTEKQEGEPVGPRGEPLTPVRVHFIGVGTAFKFGAFAMLGAVLAGAVVSSAFLLFDAMTGGYIRRILSGQP